MVEEALKLGYAEEGIEACKWLQQKARERGAPVHLGILPHPKLTGSCDVVTLMDVIEHVSDPVVLKRDARNALPLNLRDSILTVCRIEGTSV